MLKIIEVTPILNAGGAEKIVRTLASTIDRKEFSVTVFCLYSINQIPIKNVRTIFLDKKKGIDFSIIPKLMKELKKEDPDIIHNHHIFSLFYIIVANRLSVHKKIVQTIHTNLKLYLIPPIFWRILFGCFGIYSVNLATSLNRIFQSYQKNTNIPNGIEIEKFLKIRRTKKPQFSIINIGRFEKHKDQILLLKIFKSILKKDSRYKLILIGQGRLRNKLARYIEKLGLQRSVRLIDRKVNPVDYYKKARFFFLTSNLEGHPLVLIEALAAGLIIFSTPAGATETIINHGKNGFILDPKKNPQELANFFLDKSSGKIKLNQPHSNARSIKQVFGARMMCKKYEILFKKLAQEKS